MVLVSGILSGWIEVGNLILSVFYSINYNFVKNKGIGDYISVMFNFQKVVVDQQMS